MKKQNTSPISGMQELLPGAQLIFDQLKSQIAEVYHAHGFLSIETPIIDRTDILLAKAGGDTEKQIYKVIKTTETASDADQALRFDHTVPLARYVVEHENDLTFPFRVTQIGRNFRGERAQKGRFREFYQLDVDVIGRGTLPIAYDAEIVATAVDALNTFIEPPFIVHISNRKLLTGLLDSLDISDRFDQVSNVIDHIDKMKPEDFLDALREAAGSDGNSAVIESFVFLQNESSIKTPRDMLRRLREFGNIEDLDTNPNTNTEAPDTSIKNPSANLDTNTNLYAAGLRELETVVDLLEAQGITNFVIDPRIIRGLDYYTGTVFETVMPDYPEIGSICSGGRYENLAAHYTDQSLPGVGISIGLTRLFYILNANNLLPGANPNTNPSPESSTKSDKSSTNSNPATPHITPIDFAILPISADENIFSVKLAQTLRQKGFKTDVILTDRRLGDKLTHAAKIAKYAIVIGENETKLTSLADIPVKNLVSGEKTPLGVLWNRN